MPTTDSRYQVASLKPGEAGLKITWQDGHESVYPAVWLLEACCCEVCGDTRTAVRQFRLTDKPRRPRPQDCRHDAAKLRIDWGKNHHSSYDLIWLRSMCLSSAARRQRKFQPRLWGSEMAQQLPRYDYAAVAASADCHLKFLESILDYGFAILQQVPAAQAETTKIAGLVGELRLTNYGIYELESKPRPEIVGDTAVALAAHTDEPYRIDPPGITFFHVIAQSRLGGASTLLDSFNLATCLRQQDPAAFEILRSVSAGFHRHLSAGRIFEYQHPIIQTDSDGDLTCLRLLDRALTPVDCEASLVQPFYDALRTLLEMSYRDEQMIEFKLQAGEMLVFNNQRLMHGRRKFDASTSRHIRSCHVDLDEFYSRLRILYAKRQDPRRWMTFRKD